MNVKDELVTAKGHWDFQVFEGDVQTVIGEDGSLKEVQDLHGNIVEPVDHFEGDNLIVTTGKQLLLDRLFAMGGTPTQVNSMGVGATAAAAVVGDTQLGSTPTIKAFDALPTRSGLVVTCITTFLTTDANISWNELGLFNGTVNGTSIMFNHIAPIGPFNKTSAVSIVVTVTVTQS